MKKCNTCGKIKYLDQFYSYNKQKVNKEVYIYYNPKCKECCKKSAKKWAENNREKYLAAKVKYNHTSKGRKTLKRAYDKRKKEGYFQEYYLNNPEKFKEYNYKHKHKLHDITNAEWNYCKNYFKNVCAYCGIDEKTAKKEQGHYFHKEHAINEGSNDITNCVPSCRDCNSEKNTLDFDDWFNKGWNQKYTQERFDKIVKWLTEDSLKINIKQ